MDWDGEWCGRGWPLPPRGSEDSTLVFFSSKSCILVRSTYSDATVNKLLYDVCYMCVSYSLPILYGSCVIYLFYFLFVYTWLHFTLLLLYVINLSSCCGYSIHGEKWRHSNLWSQYGLHVVGNDVVLCQVNWWRFVTLCKWKWVGMGLRKASN